MKIEFPLETWTDLFAFVPRSQLAKLLPHIKEQKRRKRTRQGGKCWSAIGDWQFVSFVQFYLHKCGQITLDDLEITTSQRVPLFVNNAKMELHLAKVAPISQNIKNFQKITIRNIKSVEKGTARVDYFAVQCYVLPYCIHYNKSDNESVFHFLEQFTNKSLFTDVNLDLFCDSRCEYALCQFLPKFLPLVTSIDSIEFDGFILPLLENNKQFGRDMLTSARVLFINDKFDWVNCYRRWLQTPREDNKPRVLIASNVHIRNTTRLTSFVKNIKNDFLETNEQAVSFFLKVYNPIPWRSLDNIVEFDSLNNAKTQEKLVINPGDNECMTMTISRYPMAASVAWIEEMEKSVEEMEDEWSGDQKRRIELKFPIF